MKKLCLLVLLVFVLSSHYANAQMLVSDAGLNALMAWTGAEQVLHYAQVVNEYVLTAARFEEQLRQWATEGERWAKQLASVTDIRSFDDYMDWYNRSLEAERRLINYVTNANIQIGRKKYSWQELDRVGADVMADLKWYDEFTEEQRREMWLNLGLTPANYAYVQPYRAAFNKAIYEAFESRNAVENWMKQTMEESAKRQKKIKEDYLLPEDDKMTEKQALMHVLSTLNEQNVTLGMMAEMQALELELLSIEKKLNDEAPNFVKPPVSANTSNAFRPLDSPSLGTNK